MKTKGLFLILAVVLTGITVLNIQSVSASTSDKMSKKRVAVRKADLNRILTSSISYPSDAVKQDLQGTFKVLAVIEPDGRVSGVRILQDIGGTCAREVSRAVCSLQYSPYYENGIATRYALVVKVNFRLHE
jgi:outer membrane biosynthesis protein TonB